jgi:hypothetical protein
MTATRSPPSALRTAVEEGAGIEQRLDLLDGVEVDGSMLGLGQPTPSPFGGVAVDVLVLDRDREHPLQELQRLVDRGGVERPSRTAMLVELGLATFDRPPDRLRLFDLEGAVGIDGFHVDLGQRPVREVGQQVR